MTSKYAVLFKTHSWDEFIERQYRRLASTASQGDVFILMDESSGGLRPPEHANVIPITQADLDNLKLPLVSTSGSTLWYNTDYSLYVFVDKAASYDYYLSVEYDVVTTIDCDELVRRLEENRTDYLGFPLRVPASMWPWYVGHLPLYGADMLTYLSCFSAFSHRAISLLRSRREAMAVDLAHGRLPIWPNNEAFIANEIRLAGLNMQTLDAFGATDQYDWWPPMEEDDLGGGLESVFIHPVLHGSRYVRSMVHHAPSVASLMLRGGATRRKLRRFDPLMVRPIIRSELQRRLKEWINRKLERVGLRRKWFETMNVDEVRSGKRPSMHNAA